MAVIVIARLIDMCMADIPFQWGNLGMLSWHVDVIMIYYCRYVDIRDSFLLGQLLEQRWL